MKLTDNELANLRHEANSDALLFAACQHIDALQSEVASLTSRGDCLEQMIVKIPEAMEEMMTETYAIPFTIIMGRRSHTKMIQGEISESALRQKDGFSGAESVVTAAVRKIFASWGYPIKEESR